MEYFEIKQEQEDTWSVSSKGCVLHVFSTEKEARSAALILASDMCEAGTQASIVITPLPELSHFPQYTKRSRQFTGM